jgi:hypothetical protein
MATIASTTESTSLARITNTKRNGAGNLEFPALGFCLLEKNP